LKTYRNSRIAIKVLVIGFGIFGIFLFFGGFIIIIDVFEHAWSVILSSLLWFLFSFALPFLLWVGKDITTITIDDKKLVSEFDFLVKRISTLEAHQIEGVDIKQGIFGKKYNYGILTISGTGGKKIRTPLLDSPEEVAKEIRKINPKLS